MLSKHSSSWLPSVSHEAKGFAGKLNTHTEQDRHLLLPNKWRARRKSGFAERMAISLAHRGTALVQAVSGVPDDEGDEEDLEGTSTYANCVFRVRNNDHRAAFSSVRYRLGKSIRNLQFVAAGTTEAKLFEASTIRGCEHQVSYLLFLLRFYSFLHSHSTYSGLDANGKSNIPATICLFISFIQRRKRQVGMQVSSRYILSAKDDLREAACVWTSIAQCLG